MRAARWLALAAALAAASACARPETVRVELAGQPFDLELALDRETRQRGLGGRRSVSARGGMLFVFEWPRPLAVVMRDCAIPLDVAFLDAGGRVVAIHQMAPDPPRRADETRQAYESRLRDYPSGGDAQFIIETAGGRLAEVGLRVGQRVDLDAEALLGRHPARGP